MSWQEEALKRREESGTWIKLGAAQERLELLELLRAQKRDEEWGSGASGALAQVIRLLERRQQESGVQVHSCTAADMEPTP